MTEEGGRRGLFLPPTSILVLLRQHAEAAQKEREGFHSFSFSPPPRENEGGGKPHLIPFPPPIPPPLDPWREKSPWGRVGGTLLRPGGELQEEAQNQRI